MPYRSYNSNNSIFYPSSCLKLAGWMANSVDLDQTPHIAASDLGLHCLHRPVCQKSYGKYMEINRIFNHCVLRGSLLIIFASGLNLHCRTNYQGEMHSPCIRGCIHILSPWAKQPFMVFTINTTPANYETNIVWCWWPLRKWTIQQVWTLQTNCLNNQGYSQLKCLHLICKSLKKDSLRGASCLLIWIHFPACCLFLKALISELYLYIECMNVMYSWQDINWAATWRQKIYIYVCPAKIQIIRAGWSESSLGIFWIAKDAKVFFFYADNEGSDQTARMRRLICVFVWYTS